MKALVLVLGVAVALKTRGPLYVPVVRQLSKAECLKKYPPKKFGGFCDFYGGAEETEKCSRGYHADEQQACYGFGAAEIPTLRYVCHENGSAIPSDACGVRCTEKRTP